MSILFKTIAEVEQSTNEKLKKIGIELPSNFVATLVTTSIDRADCGSDVVLREAKKRRVDPESMTDEVLNAIGDSRFSISRGFLNFYGEKDRGWLFTEERSTCDTEQQQQHLPTAIGIVTSELESLSIPEIRVKSQALFHLYLLLKIQPSILLCHGDKLVEVTPTNFLQIAKQFLLSSNVSVNATHPSFTKQSVFLHVSPKGLPRSVYQQIVAAPQTKFRTLDRAALSCGSVIWPHGWLNEICSDDTKLASTIWYLSLPLQGPELDPTVVANSENANIVWWIKKIVNKSTLLNIPNFFSIPQTNLEVLSETDRKLILAIKFFQWRLTHSARTGEIQPFLINLQHLLTYQERQLNHPSVRQAINKNSLSELQRFILPGIVSQLELFSR